MNKNNQRVESFVIQRAPRRRTIAPSELLRTNRVTHEGHVISKRLIKEGLQCTKDWDMYRPMWIQCQSNNCGISFRSFNFNSSSSLHGLDPIFIKIFVIMF